MTSSHQSPCFFLLNPRPVPWNLAVTILIWNTDPKLSLNHHLTPLNPPIKLPPSSLSPHLNPVLRPSPFPWTNPKVLFTEQPSISEPSTFLNRNLVPSSQSFSSNLETLHRQTQDLASMATVNIPFLVPSLVFACPSTTSAWVFWLVLFDPIDHESSWFLSPSAMRVLALSLLWCFADVVTSAWPWVLLFFFFFLCSQGVFFFTFVNLVGVLG